MEKLIVILVSIVLVILDNSLVPFFSINGVYPSLLFTFAIAYSIINGREKAVFIGAISGILQDLFFFYGFGVNSLLNLFLCIAASLIGENIFKSKRLIPVISTLILTILKYIGIFIIFYLLKIKMDFSKSLIMGIYNAIIMLLCYKLVMRISNEEYKKRPWRFK
ncbi:rod shape-determining protein MreD [Clostridium sp. CTA-5]